MKQLCVCMITDKFITKKKKKKKKKKRENPILNPF